MVSDITWRTKLVGMVCVGIIRELIGKTKEMEERRKEVIMTLLDSIDSEHQKALDRIKELENGVVTEVKSTVQKTFDKIIQTNWGQQR